MYPAQAPGAGTGAASCLVAKGFGWWKKGGCRPGVGYRILHLVLVSSLCPYVPARGTEALQDARERRQAAARLWGSSG